MKENKRIRGLILEMIYEMKFMQDLNFSEVFSFKFK